MTKIGRRVRFCLAEGIRNLRRSGFISLVAIATISLSLFVLGIYLLLATNLRSLIYLWEDEVNIVAFLQEGITKEEVRRLEQRILKIEGIANAQYLSKEEALREFTKDPELKALVETLGFNPLPASFNIKVAKRFYAPDKIKEISLKIEKMVGVEEVKWVTELSALVQVIKYTGLVLGVILSGAALLIISNTIRLTVFARHEEIEIMRLVGATNWFIRGPFLMEGVFQGIMGAIVAILLLYGTFRLLTYKLNPLFSATFVSFKPTIGLVAIGGIIGLLGSMISVRRFLKI